MDITPAIRVNNIQATCNNLWTYVLLQHDFHCLNVTSVPTLYVYLTNAAFTQDKFKIMTFIDIHNALLHVTKCHLGKI